MTSIYGGERCQADLNVPSLLRLSFFVGRVRVLTDLKAFALPVVGAWSSVPLTLAPNTQTFPGSQTLT